MTVICRGRLYFVYHHICGLQQSTRVTFLNFHRMTVISSWVFATLTFKHLFITWVLTVGQIVKYGRLNECFTLTIWLHYADSTRKLPYTEK